MGAGVRSCGTGRLGMLWLPSHLAPLGPNGALLAAQAGVGWEARGP
jgi:hypothetical protein